MIEKINEAVKYIKEQVDILPEVGIVLGSGLGSFTSGIEITKEIDYSSIPNFPVSTVVGHKGKMIFGKMGGKNVLAMAGRFHFYEGYDTSEVVFPIRVMKYLGIKTVLISNAAGGVNKSYQVGDLMIINDHIGTFTPNPLIGKNFEEFGPRFPDLSEPYSKTLISKAKEIAANHNIEVREGVYLAVTGPTFETRAEYKMIHVLGADVVGMSTVQETIVAVHMGMTVFAMSVVTDIGIREEDNVITHEEVLEAAKEAEPKLTKIFSELIAGL